MKHCYKLTIAYDGTCYSGWQIQPNAPSIQELLQNSLQSLLSGQPVSVIGSGRTDAGVHALAQVAHFKTDHCFNLDRLLWALNGLLPKDVRIKKAEEAPLHFHSQFSSIGKEYHYHLFTDRVLDPFRRFYGWHLLRRLDPLLLKEAAAQFLGVHDFTSFANEPHAGAVSRNPVRNLRRLDVRLLEGEIRLEFEADGFLYKMVRNIVGTLVEVASGRIPLSQIAAIFESKDRRKACIAAPPQGLFLVRVIYPPHFSPMAHKEGK